MAVKNLYQVDQTYDPRATLKNQGVAGVLGENIGRAAVGAYKGVKKATKAQYDAERMLLSGAMEGTGKLLFGQDNKPTFGMSDDMPAALPMPTIGNQAQASQAVQQGNWQGNWSPNPEMSRVARPSVIKPYLSAQQANEKTAALPMPTATKKPVTDAPIIGIPMSTGVKGVSKIVGKDGKVTYDNTVAPIINTGKPQIDYSKPMGWQLPDAKTLAQSPVDSQLTREEAAAAENKRQNLALFAPQVGMNPMLQEQLQRSMDNYNRGMSSGSVAGKVDAKHEAKMIDDLLRTQGQATDQQLKANENAQVGNQFYAKLSAEQKQAQQDNALGAQEAALKNRYYESMINENNAQARAATMPKLGQGNEGREWEVKEETVADGSTQLVRVNKATGIKEPFKLTPEQKAQQTALSNYKLAMEKLNMLDKDSPMYAQRLNALDNDPEVKQLRALGLI